MTASARPAGEQWEFAGWGKADRITDLDTGPTTVKRLDQPVRHLLGTWRATAQLRVDFLAVKGKFGPELIERLSQRLGVAKNYMFIGTPGDRFPHRIEQLGGVRLII